MNRMIKGNEGSTTNVTRVMLTIMALLTVISFAGLGLGDGKRVEAQQPVQDPTRENRPPKEKPAEQQDTAPGQISTVTVNVRLPITVSDSKSGRFVIDLKQQDFEIMEDREAQKIESFLSQTELPLDIAVLMDTSNSVKPDYAHLTP
jgi:hypothetical protein